MDGNLVHVKWRKYEGKSRLDRTKLLGVQQLQLTVLVVNSILLFFSSLTSRLADKVEVEYRRRKD